MHRPHRFEITRSLFLPVKVSRTWRTVADDPLLWRGICNRAGIVRYPVPLSSPSHSYDEEEEEDVVVDARVSMDYLLILPS